MTKEIVKFSGALLADYKVVLFVKIHAQADLSFQLDADESHCLPYYNAIFLVIKNHK